jgi:hypothetical protein
MHGETVKPSAYISLNMRDQVSNPCKTVHKIIVPYTLIFAGPSDRVV